MQRAKLIGLRYQGKDHYAMFIYLTAFASPEEVRLLAAQAGVAPGRAGKYLLIAPLDGLCYGGNLRFSNMPGELQPREPYVYATDFLRERWTEISSGALLDIDAVRGRGLAGAGGDIDQYVITAAADTK